MATHQFRVIQECPCPQLIAPFIAIVLNDAKASATSIYRGTDAEAILNKYGKHSQAQLYEGYERHEAGFLPANPPGHSTHELKSDGVAYPQIGNGKDLDCWMQGFDVDDQFIPVVMSAATKHHWELFRPYPSGSEYHHLNFKVMPVARGIMDKARVLRLRATLPRK
jgi:hypothetical protein